MIVIFRNKIFNYESNIYHYATVSKALDELNEMGFTFALIYMKSKLLKT
jgi:ribonuclease HI